MALSGINFQAQAQANVVVPGVAGLVKVASLQSGMLGEVAAVGVAAGVGVSWSLQGNPGAAITLSAKVGDPARAELRFNAVPPRVEPYLLVIQATTPDGAQAQIPLAILVREPLALRERTRPDDASVTLTGHTYDDSLEELSFHALGPGGGAAADVCFIPPQGLPQGLQFGVGDDGIAYLTPAPRTYQDPSGGIQTDAISHVVTLRAYRPGSLYDTPATAAELQVTYDLSPGSKTGTATLSLGAAFDPTERGIGVDARVAFVGGKAPAYTLEWSLSAGAVGAWVQPAPGTTTQTAMWKPSGVTIQDVSITVRVLGANSQELASATVGPLRVSGKDPNDATPASNWTTTTAVPVQIAPTRLYPQGAGRRVYYRVTLPDLTTNESATVTTQVVARGGAGAIGDIPAPATILATSPTKDVVLGLTLPADALPNHMWDIQVVVAVTGGTTRSGFAQILAVSTGAPALRVTPASQAVAGSTGGTLDPVTLRAYTWAQKALPATPSDAFLYPTPSAVNSDLVEVSGVAFRAVGAPAGLAPHYTGGIIQLQGLLAVAGSTALHVTAHKAAYHSGSTATPISLAVQQATVPVAFTSFTSSNAQVAPDQGFTLAWGHSGSGTLRLQRGNDLPAEDVSGNLSDAQTPIATSTPFILRAQNTLQETFSSPVLVQLGSSGSATQLPPSPAVVVVDEHNRCFLAWEPTAILGSTAAYAYWRITAKDSPAAGPAVAPGGARVTGLEPGFGGTDRARAFEFDFTAGYHEISMQAFPATIPGETILASQPWDTYKAFPGLRTLTPDKDTVSRGEAMTFTLGACDGSTGVSGDRWKAVYSDGTASEWFPPTITAVAKSFAAAGEHTVTVLVEADYSTAAPAVKLQRSITLKVFVQDQDYQGGATTQDLPGSSVGLGGEAGFDITTGVTASQTLQPFLVMVPAIVRDSITNELKLLVATARGRDASSLLGTMALDVFPLAGRPHSLDLLRARGEALASDGDTYELVKITTDTLPDWVVGQPHAPVQLQVKEGSGIPPYKWFAQGLPAGLTLNVDGTLSGMVMALGTHTLNISVQDSQNPASLDERTYTLVAKSDLSIVTPTTGAGAPQGAAVGSAYTASLVAQRGVAPYLWSLAAGSIPPGLELQADGTITGTATTVNSDEDFETPYAFVAQVTDAVGAKASRQYTLTLAPQPLEIGDPDQSEIPLGQQSKVRIPVIGGRPGYTLVRAITPQGLLKAPVSLVNGILEVWVSEAFTTEEDSVSIPVRVRDSAGTELATVVGWRVVPGIPIPRWTAAALEAWVDGAEGLDGRDVRTHVGGTVSGLSYEALQVLPTLTTADAVPTLAEGVVEVRRPVLAPQNQETTFRVTVAQGPTRLGKISREYSVQTVAHVGETLNWVVKALPVRVGEPFAFDLSAPALNPSPARPILASQRVRVAFGSSLPSGVSLNALNGVVYGRFRSASAPPRTSFEVVTGNVVNATVAVDWAVVGAALAVRGTLPPVEVGQLYGGAGGHVLTVGGAVGAVSASLLHGRLPEGLDMTVVAGPDGAPQVKFSGRPLEAGYFDLYLKVSDYSGQTGFYRARLFVHYLPYLTGATQALPKIVAGFGYTAPLHAIGGKPGYTWSLAAGSPALPADMTLTAEGVLTGTSTATGYDATVVFEVADTYGQTAQLPLQVQVGAADPLDITTVTLPTGLVGTPYIGAQIQATGGVPPTSWAATALPAGMTLDGPSGMLSGTPTAVFDQVVTFTVTDAMGSTKAEGIRLTVEAATDFRVTTTGVPPGRVGQVYNGGGATAAALRASSTQTPVRVAGSYVPVRISGKAYTLALGGLTNPRAAGTTAPLPATPALLDPDTVVGGTRTGSWAPANWPIVTDPSVSATVNVSAFNLTDRAFAAAVSLSDTEFVLIGGAALGAAYAALPWVGSLGRSIGPLVEDTTSPTPQTLWPIVFGKIVEAEGMRSLTLIPGPQLPNPGVGGSTAFHAAAATRIDASRVLILGGTSIGLQHASPADGYAQAVAPNVTGREAYVMQLAVNRRSSTLTRVADMPVALMCTQAITLLDGRVLVIGGLVRSGVGVIDPAGSTTCLLYNPTTNTWTTGPALPTKEYGHSAVRLADGRVLYGGRGAFYIADKDVTAWVEDVARSGYAPSGWGGMTTLADGEVLYLQGTDNAVVQEDQGVLIPNLLIQDTLDGYLGYFQGSYAFAAAPGHPGTYYLNPGAVAGGAPGLKLQADGGNRPYNTWAMTPDVPGLSLDPATGLLSGTPTEGYDAVVSFSAKDSLAPGEGGPRSTTPRPLRVTMVDPNAPVWVTATLPQGHLEEEFPYQLVAKAITGEVLTGTFQVSPFSVVGLPAGITLSASGLLSGKTSVRGERKVTIRVTQPGFPTRFTDREFTLDFVCNTRITTTVLPQATPTLTYPTTRLAVAGGKAPYTFTCDQALPTGLSLNAVTGDITGTVGTSADKDVDVTFHVTDPNGCTGTTTLRFPVRNVTVGVGLTPLTVVQGDAYAGTLAATGGQAPYTWTASGLPAGFSLNSTAQTVTASAATTMATAAGTKTVTLTCVDAQGLRTVLPVTLTVVPPDFVWRSGPQVSGNAWTTLTDNIPVAVVWDVLPQETYVPTAEAFYKGAPWSIVIDGAFKTATPTLNPGLVGLSATLGSMSADRRRVIFHLTYTGETAGALVFTPTLTDGSTVARGPKFVTIRKAVGSTDFWANERVVDAQGTAPATSYTDFATE